MKKHLVLFSMLLLVCAGLFAQNVSLEQAVQSSAQTIESRLAQGSKVAVLAFTAQSQNFSDYIIDELAIAIGNNNKIMVIDRQYTDIIRKELNIQMSGDVSDDDIKRVGIQLGAQFVITGSLVDIGNAYRFRVIAINVETAVRVAANPVNININDPQVVFLLTGERKTSVANSTATSAVNSDAASHFEKGKASYDRLDNDAALIEFNEAIKIDPNYALAYFYCGNVYYRKNNNNRAIAEYTQAIKIDPNYALAYINRGNIYYSRKNYDLAIADFSQALRIDPNNSTAKNRLEAARNPPTGYIGPIGSW